jgi:hypothetical protein
MQVRGCRDYNGNLLKTDQRGQPRPDKEEAAGTWERAKVRATNVQNAFVLLKGSPFSRMPGQR